MDDASNLPQDESWGVEKGGGGVVGPSDSAGKKRFGDSARHQEHVLSHISQPRIAGSAGPRHLSRIGIIIIINCS